MKKPVNYTIPECRIYDYTIGDYVSCQYCNTSSISNTNVTFACYSNSICSTSSSPISTRTFINPTLSPIVRVPSSKPNYKPTVAPSSIPTFSPTYAPTQAIEAASTLDGIKIFNSVATEVSSEFISVLTVNPTSLDLQAAQSVIILAGSLLFVLIAGMIIFKIWDIYDKPKIITRMVMQDDNDIIYNHKNKRRDSSNIDNENNSRASSSGIPSSEVSNNHNSHKNSHKSSASKSKKASVNTWTNRKHLSILNEDYAFDEESDISNPIRDAWRDSDTFHTPYKEELRKANSIDKFMRAVLPIHIIEETNEWKRFLHVLLTQHRYIRVFSEPSLTEPRLLRFLAVIRIILIAIFMDTLFFQISYPATNCSAYTTRNDCLTPTSPIGTICQWNPSNSQCSSNNPANSTTFYFLISLFCLLMVAPIDLIYDNIFFG